MPNINVEVGLSLLSDVRKAACLANLTQRDWIIRALTFAIEHNQKLAVPSIDSPKLPANPAPTAIRREEFGKLVPDAKCWCGSQVVEAFTEQGVSKYKCIDKGHFSSKPPKEKA